MSRSRFAVALLLALFLVAPSLAAQDGPATVPPGAEEAEVGPATALAWVTADPQGTGVAANITAGTNGTLHLALDVHENGTYNATFSVTVGAGAELLTNGTVETGNLTVGNATNGPESLHEVPFHVPSNATGTASFTVDVELYRYEERNATGNDTGNATAGWVLAGTGTLTPAVDIVQPPTPPGPADEPNWILIGAVAFLVAAGAAGAGYAWYQRRQEPMAPRRSQALQELEAEEKRKPEAREEALEEAQQAQEQARQNRELQILEAKADDHRRGIELARKRKEKGEITDHQFQRIKERKEEALEQVLEEIEEVKES